MAKLAESTKRTWLPDATVMMSSVRHIWGEGKAVEVEGGTRAGRVGCALIEAKRNESAVNVNYYYPMYQTFVAKNYVFCTCYCDALYDN